MSEPIPERLDTALESDDGLADIIEAINAPSGQLHFRGWELPFWLNEPAEEDGEATEVNEHVPGAWAVRPRVDQNRYLPFLFVWEGVPEPFKKILLYHEAQEATLALGRAEDYIVGGPQGGQMERRAAHAIAQRLHEMFAARTLNAEQLEAFHRWMSTLPPREMSF